MRPRQRAAHIRVGASMADLGGEHQAVGRHLQDCVVDFSGGAYWTWTIPKLSGSQALYAAAIAAPFPMVFASFSAASAAASA
jgi:hypothetical protein